MPHELEHDPEATADDHATDGHPLEGGQTDAVDNAQEVALDDSSAPPEHGSFVIVFPDGTKTIEAFADNGGYPRRGEEVSPGWIANDIVDADARGEDLKVNGELMSVEVKVVPRDEFVA